MIGLPSFILVGCFGAVMGAGGGLVVKGFKGMLVGAVVGFVGAAIISVLMH